MTAIDNRSFIEKSLHTLGSPVSEFIEVLFQCQKLYLQCIRRFFKWPWRWHEIHIQISSIAIGSLPIICIATAFAGLVITKEVATQMNQALHTVQMIPGFTGQFIIRELGIAIPALLVVSKVGASITAEIGTMKITEQIDALKLLKVDTVSYLVFPRWIACILACICLTLFSIGISLAFAILLATFNYHFSPLEYLNALRHYVGPMDIICALIKSIVFGSIIPIISCTYGLRCQGGAQGVGSATTNAVVTATISVIIWDFIITSIFSSIL